jgi:hypothetical protein
LNRELLREVSFTAHNPICEYGFNDVGKASAAALEPGAILQLHGGTACC